MKKMMPMMIIMLIIVLSSAYYAWMGVSMHQQVPIEEAAFHEVQTDYWSLDKSTRDSAVTNSVLNKQLVEIKNYPSELLRLKLVGVGNILTGIFILLFGILIALIIMPVRLGGIINKRK